MELSNASLLAASFGAFAAGLGTCFGAGGF
jgi:hypothetical protein